MFKSPSPAAAFGAAVAINSIVFAFVLGLGHATFEENDDVALMSIVSGLMTGQPDAHLVFTNALIGLPLAALYRSFGNIEWYSLYLYAVQFIAMTAVAGAIIRRWGWPIGLVSIALIYVGFEARNLLSLQFTTTASLAGSAGLALIWVGHEEDGARSRLAMLSAGVALIVLCALIRFESFQLILLLSLPWIVAAATASFSSFAPRRRLALAGAIIASALLAFCAAVSDSAWYKSDPGWARYTQYNRTRAPLHDRPGFLFTPETRPVFESVGWSRNDHEMFMLWFFTDPDIYSLEKLSVLSEHFAGASRAPETIFHKVRDRLSVSWPALLVVFVMLAGPIVLAEPPDRRRAAIRAVFGAGAALAAVGALLIWAKLPDRVFNSIVLFVSIAALTCSGGFAASSQPAPPGRTIPKRAGLLLVALLIPAVIFLLRDLRELNHMSQLKNSAVVDMVDQLEESFAPNSDSAAPPVFVLWANMFPYRWLPPLRAGSVFGRIDTIMLGWPTGSPLFEASLARHGVEDLYSDLFEREDLFLFAKVRHIEALLGFISEHKTRPALVKTAGVYLYKEVGDLAYFAVFDPQWDTAPQ